jgi:hypothetical protein
MWMLITKRNVTRMDENFLMLQWEISLNNDNFLDVSCKNSSILCIINVYVFRIRISGQIYFIVCHTWEEYRAMMWLYLWSTGLELRLMYTVLDGCLSRYNTQYFSCKNNGNIKKDHNNYNFNNWIVIIRDKISDVQKDQSGIKKIITRNSEKN